MMTRTFWLCALLTLCILSTSLMLHTAHSTKPNLVMNVENPDAFMTKVNLKQYQDTGLLQSMFSAEKIVHFVKQDTAHFINLSLQLNTKKHSPWFVSAKTGVSQEDMNIIYLNDKVRFYQPKNKNTTPTLILTDHAVLHPKESLGSTTHEVTIKQENNLIHAKGMQADLKKNTIVLLSQTRDVYTAQKQP